MIDDATLLREQLLDDLPSPYDGELEVVLTRGVRSRRRRRAAIASWCVASVCVAAGVTGVALSATRPSSHLGIADQGSYDRCVTVPGACLPGVIGLGGKDPTTGRPFATAAEASAAGGGLYVPDCPGHGAYYLQDSGSVVMLLNDGDTALYVSPPDDGLSVGPITGNSLVTPQQLTAQGQVAYGYEATVRKVGNEAVLVHSYLTWANRGSAIVLTSGAKLSLTDLQNLADSCT